MTKRKTEFRASYLFGTLIVIAVLVGVNLLGRARFERFDLTKDRVFTVSPAMRTILRELPDVVRVTYYVSSELPEELADVRRDTLDRFQELERLAGGNLQYRVVDVPKEIFDDEKRKEDPALERLFDEISVAGIQPAALSVQRSGSAEQVLIFTAITVTYLDKPTQYIDPYAQPERLEYDLALILVRLTQADTGKPIVALFDGRPTTVEIPGGSPFQPPRRGHEFTMLVEVLSDMFDVREIKLTEQSPIPDGTRCLIVAQPSELNERQLYEINRFVSAGGNAVFFVSRYAVDLSSPSSLYPLEHITPSLGALFKAWGIELGDEMVGDAELGQVALVPVRAQGGYTLERRLMPTQIMLSGEELSQQSPFTSKLAGLYFKNASPIRLDDDTLARDGIEADVLAHTSQHSWLLPVGGVPYLSILQLRPPKEDKDFDGPQTLAVVLRGTFPFTYKSRAVPPWPGAEMPTGTGGSGAPPEPVGPETPPAIEPDEASADVPSGDVPSGDETSVGEASADETPPVDNGEAADTSMDETTGETPPVVAPTLAPPVEPKPAIVLVVSTADMMKFGSRDMPRSQELIENHIAFMSGALETLTQGHNLASIRAKTTAYRPFQKATRTKLTVYTILNLVPVPVVVVVLGVFRYAARRRSRRVYRNRQLSRAKGAQP